jgi:hypothetical protein
VNNGNAKEFAVEDVENMLVPKITIDYDISRLSKRKIKPIFEEVLHKDRKDLDSSILRALGLDVDEYLPRIYKALCETVQERLELPKMRKKQQKETVKLAVDQIKQSVIEQCLAEGPKRFPEQFYDHPLSDKELNRYSTSGELLRYEHFFGQYQMMDEKGQKVFTVDSEDKAQFAIVLAKPDIYEIKIPKDEKMIIKALNKYHKYLRELEEKLAKSASQQTHDWAIADRIAKEIMAEYGL